MAIENFLDGMNALVDELRSHPKVTVLNYYVPSPVTEQDFLDVEAHIGRTLPLELKAFYRQCNGLQLRWVHKENKNVDQKLWASFMEGPFEYEEIVIEPGIEGVVNILGVRETFFRSGPFQRQPLKERERAKLITIAGKDYLAEELVEIIWSFDILNNSYDFGLLLRNDSEEVLVILMGSQHRKPDIGIPVMTLAQYLELVFLKKGCADSRIFQLIRQDQIDYNSATLPLISSLEDIFNPNPYDLNQPYHR